MTLTDKLEVNFEPGWPARDLLLNTKVKAGKKITTHQGDKALS